MATAYASSFGVIDYCFFSAMLLISLVIGAFATFRGNKSPEDFLMGNRSFGPVPVAFSLMTSIVSAITILGFSGETYAYGMQIVWYIVGIVLGIGCAVIVILPVLYPLKLTSVNQYLGLRFNSPNLSKTVTIITVVQAIIYMGSNLYAPTLALAAVTPLTSLTYIFILGAVVTLYSSAGGIRAVIWTDVFQLVVMVTGLVVVVAAGLYQLGGVSNVWNTAMAGGRFEIFDINPSIYVRHTLWNTIGFGFYLCFAFFGISQTNVQRMCAVSSFRDIQKITLINIFGMVFIYFLIFFGGILSYAAYADCDPWKLGILKKKEEIMPYFIVDRLNFIPGLPGIFVATIIGGSLSSLSSALNAVVAMLWTDCLSKMELIKNVQPVTAGIINKVLSFLIGGIVIGAAFVATKASNLVQFSLAILTGTFGPILGAFLLGLLFPKTNIKGVWTALAVGVLFNAWISLGAFLYDKALPPLPLSIEKCPTLSLNGSVLEDGNIYHSSHNNITSDRTVSENNLEDSFPLMKLYGISYTLHGFFGTSLCIVVGIIASCITGNQDLDTLSPKYVSPVVRRIYWDKEYLDFAAKEDELQMFQESNGEMKHINHNNLPKHAR